jgi:hypothetical protein
LDVVVAGQHMDRASPSHAPDHRERREELTVSGALRQVTSDHEQVWLERGHRGLQTVDVRRGARTTDVEVSELDDTQIGHAITASTE